MPKLIDYTGRQFGRLTVIKRLLISNGYNSRIVECLCNPEYGGCGKIANFDISRLVDGAVVSCGCYRKERATKHGLHHTAEYKVWMNIKMRCYNEKNDQYSDYGGRGIVMSDEWRDSFEAFYRDMGPRPSSHYTVERRENNEGYTKENCHWVTRIEQANNTRRNVFYCYNGVCKTLSTWCRELNLNYNTVYQKINRCGQSLEEIINDLKRSSSEKNLS